MLRTRPRSAIAFCIPIIGCLNTDFGRVRPSLLNDDIHSWMGPAVAERHDEGESTFRLTEGERLLRDLAYPLIEPPWERRRWYSVVNEYGRSGIFQPNWFVYDEHAYARELLESATRTVDALYGRLIDDIRNDITRIPLYVTAARHVMDMDKRRDQSLRFIRELNPVEHGNAVARMGENLLIMRWVHQSLNERVIGYQFALERLVIGSPTKAAADAERQLTLLKLRVADTLLFPAQPQPLPIVLKGGPAPKLVTK